MTAPSAPHVRAAGYLVGSQVLASALTLVTGILVARALGPAGKGYYDIIVGSATLLATLVGLSLGSGLFYYASRGPVGRGILARTTAAVILQAAIVAGVLWMGRDLAPIRWLLPGAAALPAALLVALMLLALQGQQYAQGLIKGRGYFRTFALSELLGRGGALLGVVALVAVGSHAPAAFVLSVAVATLGAVLLLGAVLGRHATTDAGGAPFGNMLRYSLPLFLGNLVQLLNYRVDIYFVKQQLGLGAVGTYTVAVWLAQVVWLVPNALAALVLRAVAREDAGAVVFARTAAVNRMCLALSAIAGIGLALVGATGMTTIFGREFAASVRPLLLLMPGVVLFSSTIILSAYLNGVRRQALTSWVACGSLLVTVAGNLALIPRLGIAGAALTSTLSYLVSSALTVVLILRVVPGARASTLVIPQAEDLASVRAAAAVVWARLGFAPSPARGR